MLARKNGNENPIWSSNKHIPVSSSVTAKAGNVSLLNKNLDRFKTFFATVHNEWRESQSTTAGAKFHSANRLQEQDAMQLYQQETVDAISNLATATASNRATVTTLKSINCTLTSALTAIQIQLV